MRATLSLTFSLILLTACAEQIRLGTDQTRGTIPEILEDQAVNNAARAYSDPLAIPAQLTLTNSVTTASNTFNAGLSPGLAFRAIAITGLTVSSTNAINQNWAANAVTNYLDLKRLQIFYSYAVHASNQTFDQMEKSLNEISSWKAEQESTGGDKNLKKKKLPPPLSQQIGRLPPSGFITVNDPQHCRGGVETPAFQTVISLPDRVCFRPGQKLDGSNTTISPTALKSLFVLWSVAIPNAGVTDKSPLVIAAPG